MTVMGRFTKNDDVLREQLCGLSGDEADLANALANCLKKKYNFIELPWVDQISALLDNKIDIIMSRMSKTKEREAQITFTIPYYRRGQLPLVKKDRILIDLRLGALFSSATDMLE